MSPSPLQDRAMFRPFVAVLAGLLVWFVTATLGNALLRAALPGYAEVERAMAFTLPMQLARLALGALSSLAAGAATAAIGRAARGPTRVLAGVLVLLFLPVHYSLWARFPAWYHAVFLVSLPLAVLGGAALTRRAGQGRM